MSRRLLIGLYGVATVLTILTLTSLGLGFPELRFAGQEITLLMAVTLVAFVVGMIGLVDYLRWPERRNQPSGVRIMSAGVVVIGFAVGYFLGSRVSMTNNPVNSTDPLLTVIGPGDPMLSVAGGVLVGCLAAFLVWLRLRRSPLDGPTDGG